MTDRIPCLVPFCRRTRKPEQGVSEWICGKHWRMVSREVKATWRRTKARTRKIVQARPLHRQYWEYAPGSPERLSAISMWRRYDQAWERCKSAAIEAAGGIG